MISDAAKTRKTPRGPASVVFNIAFAEPLSVTTLVWAEEELEWAEESHFAAANATRINTVAAADVAIDVCR